MFFDKSFTFRLRSKDHEIINEYLKRNHDIKNISHLVRIAVLQYIRKQTDKPEEIVKDPRETKIWNEPGFTYK